MGNLIHRALVGALVALAFLAVAKAGIIGLYPPNRFTPTPQADGPAPVPECCGTGCTGSKYLAGGPDTAHWGYFYDGLEPAMVVNDGDEFIVEMPTLAANNAYELMIEGDPAMEQLYGWEAGQPPTVAMHGPYGNAGGHIMTGPVYVCGAEPGDVVQLEILELWPRPNPGKDNRTFGATINAGCGWQNRAGYLNGTNQGIVIYEIIKDPATGKNLYWEPVYSYQLNKLVNHTSPGCVPQSGEVPRTTPQGAATWNNPDYTFSNRSVPCVDGEQMWTYPFGYSGHQYVIPEELRDYSIKGKYRLPVNMHVGNLIIAPKLGATVFTTPPMRTGGNVDNRRIGIGATMYYPVEVPGALISMGDCHGGMGDGETSCTGIETSLNGRFKVTVHKAGSLPPIVQNLNYPLIENANEFVINGYAYADYVREVPNPQTNISVVGVDLNRAYTVVFNQTRDFLMTVYNLTEDESISVMGAAIDFGVTQVVDANVGVHSIIPKWLFNSSMWESEPQYLPKVMSGTSRPPELA
ncbi:hypothetical protein N2152v2_011086 [Parachlorella kessleri]